MDNFPIGSECLLTFVSFLTCFLICIVIELVNIMLFDILDNKTTRERGNLRELVKYSKKPVLDSGNYRHGFTITEMKAITPGTYVLIASTYDSGEFGKLNVTINTSVNVKANVIAWS